MIESNVDIIDIGGESTRPSSIYNDVKPLTIQEEISRVVPVISQIKKHFDVPISIDSRRAVVVREAFDAGADMINDVSMMNYDSDMINVVSDLSIPFVLTHNRKIKNGNVVCGAKPKNGNVLNQPLKHQTCLKPKMKILLLKSFIL